MYEAISQVDRTLVHFSAEQCRQLSPFKQWNTVKIKNFVNHKIIV